MNSVFLIISVFFQLFCDSNGELNQVTCEKVVNDLWHSIKETTKTCQMEKVSTIDAINMTISNVDSSIRGLSFYTNKNIMFLPVNVVESFINLIAYDASECSITKISRENFVGLERLRSLALAGNQIEKIYSDAFESLINLEYLWLWDNKIKFLNGKTFLGLTKLKEIQLESNVCIDESFKSSTALASVQETINEKCAFNEALERCVDENFFKVTEIGELQDDLLRKSEEINKLKRKVERLNEKIKLLT